MWHFDEAGALFKAGWLKLTGEAAIMQKGWMGVSASWIFRVSKGVTALSMLTSVACGIYANQGFARQTPNHPNAPLQINIPFSTLNLAIALGIVLSIVVNVFFNLEGARGLIISAVLIGFLLCNREARKHIVLRLRQMIDRFTIGGNNSFDPFVSLALVVRALMQRFTVGAHNSVAPIVSIAVVGGDQVAPPLQLFTSRWAAPSNRYAVTLPEFLEVMDVTETSM